MSQDLPRVTNLRKVLSSAFFMLAIASILIGLTTMGTLAGEAPNEPIPVTTEETTFEPPPEDPTVVTTEEVTPVVATVTASSEIQPRIDEIEDPVWGEISITPLDNFEENLAFEIMGPQLSEYRIELALARYLFNDVDDGDPNNDDEQDNIEAMGNYRSRYVFGHSIILEPNFYVSDVHMKYTSDTEPDIFYLPPEVWKNLRGSRVFYRMILIAPDGGLYKTTPDESFEEAPVLERTCGDWAGLPLNGSQQANGVDVIVNGVFNLAAQGSDLGPRGTTANLRTTRFHPGIDVPVSKGTPVYATAAGTVSRVPYQGDSVHRLDVSHGNYTLGYVHLYKAVVRRGEQVARGQLLGYTGDYGSPGDEHLHFDTGIANGQSYVNPLNYIRNNANPQQPPSFLQDEETDNQLFRVEKAEYPKQEYLIIVGFGVGTGTEKDLEYVLVQADRLVDEGQYFLLDYEQVNANGGQPKNNQGYRTGEILMNTERNLVVIPSPIFNTSNIWDTSLNFTHSLYVKPTYTDVFNPARDYFYFIWDTSYFSGPRDTGHHKIYVTLRDVTGNTTTESVTIGPEIIEGDPPPSANSVTFEFAVTNHDVANNDDVNNINLTVENLPAGVGVYAISENPVRVGPGETRDVEIILMSNGSDVSITPELLAGAGTRIVATHGRFPALQEKVVICQATNQTAGISTAANTANNDISGAMCPVSTDLPDSVITFPGNGEVLFYDPNTAIYPEVTAVNADSGTSATLHITHAGTNSTQIISKKRQDGDDFLFEWEDFEPSTTYLLVAHVSGFDESEPVEVTIGDTLAFSTPKDGYTYPPETNVPFRVWAPGADRVELEVTPAEGGKGGTMVRDEEDPDYYELNWQSDPLPVGTEQQSYLFTAKSFDVNGVKIAEQMITVYVEEINPLWIELSGWVYKDVYNDIWVHVGFDQADVSRIEMEISGNGMDLEQPDPEILSWKAGWKPSVTGSYDLYAKAVVNGVEYEYWSELQVIEPPDMEIIPINDYAVVGKVKGLPTDPPPSYANRYPTPFSSDQYVCGVVGYKAYGGDIGEYISNAFGEKQKFDPIAVFLEDKDRKWWLLADFDTYDQSGCLLGGGFCRYDDRPEKWDVDILCVSKEIARVETLTNQGDYVSKLTNISHETNICSIAGFWARHGDINEKDERDIIQVYLDHEDEQYWRVHADITTHNGSNGGDENWDLINLLCLDEEFASIDGPAPNRLFFITDENSAGNKLRNLGDNIYYDTGYSSDQFVCGIAGFAARSGDINEGNFEGSDNPLMMAYMEAKNGTWRIKADFRTEKNHPESWDFNLICASREPKIVNVVTYLFPGQDEDGEFYGPGMKIDFTDTYHPDASYYRVQYSTTGGEPWNNIWTNPRKLSDGSWINHHGEEDCGWDPSGGGGFDLYGRCLPPKTRYYYRVGLLENLDDTEPINGHWSEPVSAVSYDWPASFKLNYRKENIAHPYGTVYSVWVSAIHGPRIKFDWTTIEYLGAEMYEAEPCKNASTYCRIIVRYPAEGSSGGLATIAEDRPIVPGVHVSVTGTDEYIQGNEYRQHEYTQSIYIEAEPGGGGDPMSTFADVPPDHWATDYFESLYSQGYLSGFEQDG